MNVKDLIKRTYSIAKQANSLKKEYIENRAKIQEFFDKKGLNEVEVDPDPIMAEANHISKIIVRKSESIKLVYIPEKLKESLDKELYNEIVSKQYSISDINGLIKLIKNAGISFKDFKKCINITESVSKEKIEHLYDVGDITKEDLEGCYTATIVKSIRITERKGGTN